MDEVKEVPFGGVLTNKAEVELALRRAQAAVLNPRRKASSFATMSFDELKNGTYESKKALKFSRNAVCLDVAGPDLTDLSFIDLLGELFARYSVYAHSDI